MIFTRLTKILENFTNTFNYKILFLVNIHMRMFIYYFLSLNMLRFILIYKNKLEYGATSSNSALLEMVVFITLGDLFRFAIGDTIAYLSSYEFNQLKNSIVKDDKGKTLNNKEYIYGISIDNIFRVTCEFIAHTILLVYILTFVIFCIFCFMYFTNFCVFSFDFFKYIFIYLLSKFNLIFNSLIRNVGDRFSKSYISVFAAALQCLTPVFGYCFCNYLGYGITFPLILFFAFISSIFSTTMNYFNIYLLYNKRVVYPIFANIKKRMKATLLVLPGQILSATFTFAFIDIIMLTTPFNISTSTKIALVLAYKPFRNMYSMTLLPFVISLNLIAVRADNNKLFMNALYITSIIITILGSLGMALFIETKIYMKIFYIVEMFPDNIIRVFLYVFPIKLAEKLLEMFNVINGNNKFYNILVTIRDIGAIVIFNILYFFEVSQSASVILAFTIIIQSFLAYCISLSVAKYYDKEKEISILFSIIHLVILFIVFYISYFCFSKIILYSGLIKFINF